MKRKLAMILTGCILLSGLVGCSGASQSVSGENAKASNSAEHSGRFLKYKY